MRFVEGSSLDTPNNDLAKVARRQRRTNTLSLAAHFYPKTPVVFGINRIDKAANG
jgi:hypothetical protein